MDGNIYVAGYHKPEKDLLVISLDTAGNERWSYLSDSTNEHWEEVCTIIFGADGNLYIAGMSNILGSKRRLCQLLVKTLYVAKGLEGRLTNKKILSFFYD